MGQSGLEGRQQDTHIPNIPPTGREVFLKIKIFTFTSLPGMKLSLHGHRCIKVQCYRNSRLGEGGGGLVRGLDLYL